MKTKRFLTILTLVVLLAITATTVLAADSPYLIASFAMTDPLDPSVSWQRDTTDQNAIAQHTADQFPITPYVEMVYYGPELTVLVYHADIGPNITALISGPEILLIGPGGGRTQASYAKAAFINYYGPFTSKRLVGIIYTDANPENSQGATYWRSIFRSNPPAPTYASAAYPDVKADLDAVQTEYAARQAKALGQSLAWGPDGFLGAGSMKQYIPGLPSYADPDHLVSGWQRVVVGVNEVDIRQSPGQDAGLMVFLPWKQITIVGDTGSFLPDAASLYQPAVSVRERIQTLNYIINPNWMNDYPCILDISTGNCTYYTTPNVLIRGNGTVLFGNNNIVAMATAQRDALQSIYDQTLVRINAGDTIDEAAVAVTLPADLAASPYNQEFVSTVPGIVRSIYQEKMGWFSGNVIDLASTLTEAGKAQALAAAFAYPSLAEAAKQAELSAQDLPAAEKALYLAFMAFKASPDDFTVKQIYAQALRKNAFMQKSAQIRNYYLSAAQELGIEQAVTGFAKSGVEDAPIAFTALEFSQHFMGINGALLTTVKFTSLPTAESGVLALPGGPVSAEQEIPVADLDGLVFTPTADWNGSTSFLWNGKDGSGYAANDASLSISLDPVNDLPVLSATPLADVSVDEDASPSAIDLTTGFNDVDGEALTYTAASNAAEVSASVDGFTLTLTYQANWNGSAAITVTATDAAAVTVSDDFTVTVNPVNDSPTAADSEITVVAGKSQTITLDYGDLETAQANLTVTFGALNGTLDTSALPGLTYTAPTTAGDDSFTYTVTDRGDPDGCSTTPCAAAASSTATIFVTVLPAPSASISGIVFNDANANGLLDDGESGLVGVVVQLQDAIGAQMETFTTAADGAYTFTALDAGSYQVYAPTDADRVQTTQNPIAITLAEAQAVTGVNIGSVVSADLRVSMTYSVNNKAIIYAITVTNDGPASAFNAVMTDALPDTVAFVSVISTQGTCSGGKTVTCSLGTLANGASATITLKVNRVNTKIAVVNNATVTSTIFDIDMADNSVSTTVP